MPRRTLSFIEIRADIVLLEARRVLPRVAEARWLRLGERVQPWMIWATPLPLVPMPLLAIFGVQGAPFVAAKVLALSTMISFMVLMLTMLVLTLEIFLRNWRRSFYLTAPAGVLEAPALRRVRAELSEDELEVARAMLRDECSLTLGELLSVARSFARSAEPDGPATPLPSSACHARAPAHRGDHEGRE